MLQKHWQLGWRNLLKNKSLSFLQISGFGIGLAGFALILQYVFYEKSFDRHLPNHERLFRVSTNLYRDGVLNSPSAMTYLALGPSLQADFPAEVENHVRLLTMEGELRVGDKRFVEDQFFYTDASFPALFGLQMLQGDPATALAEPNAVILSETAARQFFGTTDCLGREIDYDNQFPQHRLFAVRGVYRDMPANSHLRSRLFFSLKTLTQTPGTLPDWAWRDFYNYVLLRPGAEQAFAEKIARTDYVGAHFPRYVERHIRHVLFLQKASDIHLHSNLELEPGPNGDAESVRSLLWVGIFLLGMSVVNFILLALATAAGRAREVGVRKAVGAGRRGLVAQFALENMPLLALSAVLAGALTAMAQPAFLHFTGQRLSFEFLKNPALLAATAFLLLGSLAAGCLLPAWVMARFSPATLLKPGAASHAGAEKWRHKPLIVLQFALVVFLLVATATVWQQLRFLQQRDPGLRLDRTIVLKIPNSRSEATVTRFQVLKTALLQHPGVRSVAASQVVPGDGGLWQPGLRKLSEDGSSGPSRIVFLNAVDESFLPAYSLRLLAGRNFRPGAAPERDALVLTETAARALGYARPEDALRERFICAGDTVAVIGVVSDYAQWGGQRLPGEYLFVHRPDEFRRLSVRVGSDDFPAMVDFLQTIHARVFPGSPFEHFFLDKHYARQYEAEARFGKIVGLFAALAVLIACLGLLGISALAAARRVREIGIRKVLGASVVSVAGLLTQDFLKLVIAAIAVASPLAYFFMQHWLADFAYRIELQGWMFAAAAGTALAAALLAVGFQSLRAALANPVEALKGE